ncbi:MAG: alpha/beta fold hydrolase [Polyangiaceae bacterium]
MPELPDIEAYLDALRPRYEGQVLERIRLGSPFVLRSYEPRLDATFGKRVLGFRRLGKRVVFGLEDDLFVVVHLMVAGRFKLAPPKAKVPKRLGLAAFDFPAETLVLTEASKKKRASIHVVRGEPGLAELDPGGVEVMGISRAAFAAALTRENHTLKRTLTDPHVFSGIGNAYSDEILHFAKLSPVKWTQRLSEAEIGRLHEATQTVLSTWIARLREEARAAFPKKVTAFRPEMAVHGKYKEPCPVCGTAVQRIVRGESEVNYCPTCQTQGKLLADRSLSRLLRGDWPKTLEELEERKAALKSAQAPVTEEPEAAPPATKPATASLADRIAAMNRGASAPKTPPPAKKAATKATKKAATKATKKAATKAMKKSRPLLLFAHGAGASSSSDWMRAWAERLGTIGEVVTFDYPYMHEGRRRPDRQDKLLAAHAEALAAARAAHGPGPVFLIGKSMGSRMGCHLSLEVEGIAGLVCLGYPLVSLGKSGSRRDEVLRALTRPILFVQGTRDALCPLDALAEVRAAMTAESTLHVVETGDHSLRCTKRWLAEQSQTQDDVDATIADAIARFIASHR